MHSTSVQTRLQYRLLRELHLIAHHQMNAYLVFREHCLVGPHARNWLCVDPTEAYSGKLQKVE